MIKRSFHKEETENEMYYYRCNDTWHESTENITWDLRYLTEQSWLSPPSNRAQNEKTRRARLSLAHALKGCTFKPRPQLFKRQTALSYGLLNRAVFSWMSKVINYATEIATATTWRLAQNCPASFSTNEKKKTKTNYTMAIRLHFLLGLMDKMT